MQEYITIGIAGHVDHGKTSLIKALTGTDTDRLKEGKQRGLSIESGVAFLPTHGDISIALIDVSGLSHGGRICVPEVLKRFGGRGRVQIKACGSIREFAKAAG